MTVDDQRPVQRGALVLHGGGAAVTTHRRLLGRADGHRRAPPAIVVDEERVPRTSGEPASLVDAFEAATFEDSRFEMRPGATLVLHTDG